MNIKKYTKLSVLAFAISAVGSVHAGIGNVCIDVKNVSENTLSLNAYDTGDALQWVALTGGPLQIPKGLEAHGCFKTAYKADGVDIVVKSIHMADIQHPDRVKTSYNIKTSYNAVKDGETLVIK